MQKSEHHIFKLGKQQLFFLLFLIISSYDLFAQVSSYDFPNLLNDRLHQILQDSLASNEKSCTISQSDFILGQTARTYKKKGIELLPFILQQQYNSRRPYGWNDAGMIDAKGYQINMNLGLKAHWGALHIQLYPQMVYALNPVFDTLKQNIPTAGSVDLLSRYWIDNPERMNAYDIKRVYWGQSFVGIQNKTLAIRVSTENSWWGPGVINSLMMSNNAPGFLHLSFKTIKPIHTSIGSFEFEFLGGVTTSSINSIYNGNDKKGYLNGLVVSYQPKWVKGLFLGITRAYNQYWDEAQKRKDYFSVFGNLFRSRDKIIDDSLFRDQLSSLYARFVFSKAHAEIYAEFGRNDASYNLRDFLMSPEHSRAFIVGGSKIFNLPSKGQQIMLQTEITHTENPQLTGTIRPQPLWYIHGQVTRGYTHEGKVIGAGVGAGGNNCKNISLKWINPLFCMGINLMEIDRGNDIYNALFGNINTTINRKWIDYVVGLNGNFFYKKNKQVMLNWNVDYIRTQNEHWLLDKYSPNDLNAKTEITGNLHLKISTVIRL